MKQNRRLLLVAIIFGVITVVALNFYLQSLDKPAMETIPHTNVVVARTTIPAHTRILPDMLEVKSLPSDGVHPEAVRSIDAISGGISRVELIAGEQILAPRVFTDERRAVLSYRIPEGMRAVSINVGTTSGVAGFISPGDHIDILITFSDGRINDEQTTYTYFQNVKVLATGSGTRERDSEDPVTVSTLTLLVTPEQAEAMVYIDMNTSLHMTLRSPLDDEIVELDSYNFEKFDVFYEIDLEEDEEDLEEGA